MTQVAFVNLSLQKPGLDVRPIHAQFFLESTAIIPCKYHSTNLLYSFSHLSEML